ncbi:MAG: hypothetical protein AAGA78_13710, partial [Pseudomonadota bacterium]
METYFSTRSTSLPTLVRYNAALTLFDTSIGAEGEAQEIGMSFRRKLAPKINFHADKTAHPGTYFVEAVVQEIDLLSTDEPTIKDSALVQHVTDEMHRSSEHQLEDFSKWVSVHSERVDDPPACFCLLEREMSDAVAIIEQMFSG